MLKPILSLLAGGILISGCATAPKEPSVVLPPISSPETAIHNPGQVIWHDLATRDLEQSKRFYGELFGWTFKQLNETDRQYTSIYLGDTVIGGMFTFAAGEKEDPHGEWLLNLSSSDVAADATKFEHAGGKILGPEREVPDRGTSAFVQGPQGAMLILTNSSSGDPQEGDVPIGGWLWNELWTRDARASLSLYTDVFGYESKPVDAGDGREYFLLTKDDYPMAGILKMRATDVRPHWVPFIRVTDVEATVTKAVSLGAQVIIKPSPEIRDGKVALLLGATGEPIVIQEFEFKKD